MAWERERFWPNAVPDIIGAAVPPPGHQFTHMAISSRQCEDISRRIGRPVTLVPNVMDFATGPEPRDGGRFREYAGLGADDILLLQPTRIVPRKNIETTIDLANRMSDPKVRVVVTHPNEDEVKSYWSFLVEHAERRGVDFRLAPIGVPGTPSLADAYDAADIVCYPSSIEGFGNAVVETMLYRKALVINRYPVYRRDIARTGVRFLEFDGRITNELVDEVVACIGDPGLYAEAVENNYEVGLQHFSYDVLRERVLPLFAHLG
jgi:glycosyltransferase involved in cell wall biosynthesis